MLPFENRLFAPAFELLVNRQFALPVAGLLYIHHILKNDGPPETAQRLAVECVVIRSLIVMADNQLRCSQTSPCEND